MVMRPLKKSALREIKHSFGRYLAILAIVALGVGFFCGLRICKTAMVETADEVIRSQNLFDARLISTLGFTQDDVAYFAALDGVHSAEGATYADFLCLNKNGVNITLRAHSLTSDINRLTLTAGRLPQAADEVVADARYFDASNLGSSIVLSRANSQDTLDRFVHNSYTIVGLTDSVYYMNYERGSTSLGTGSIAAFVYMPMSGFEGDVYAEVFIDLDTTGEIYSDEYNACLDAFEDTLQTTSEARADLRYQTLVEDVASKINDAQSSLEEKRDEYLTQKNEAVSELRTAHAQLSEAQEEITSGEEQLIQSSERLSSAQTAYNSALSDYKSAAANFAAQRESAQQQLRDAQGEIDSQRASVQSGMAQIEASGVLAQRESLADSLAQLQAALEQLESQRSAALAEIAAGREQIEAQISALDEQIAGLSSEKNAAAAAHDETIASLNAQIADLNAQLGALDESDPQQAADADSLRAQISSLESNKANEESAKSAADSDYDNKITALSANRPPLESAIADLDAQTSDANAQFDANRSPLDQQAAQVQSGLDAIAQSGVEAQYASLTDALAQLDSAQTQLDAKRAETEAAMASYQKQLNSARAKLNGYKQQIENGQTELNEGKAELESARQELQDGLNDYESALQEAENGFIEAEQQLSEAQAKIDDSRAQVEEIEPATLYSLTRKTNIGYACFESDSQIVHGISTVFPLFFFLVAVLVCMTTMTRMVDEQRTTIGTLKALGYSKAAIMAKYMFYSGSAATLGSVIGFIGGSRLFPLVIWKAYGIMYTLGSIRFVLSPALGLASYAAALVCSMGATWFSCNMELSEVPAALMRPKAPKAGKRILLERVGFIWSRLSFLRKVSLRNIMRYKKRLLMMVVGISGCTALLVTGFGINDSIANLANDQYDKISVYDYEVSFTNPQDAAAQAEFRARVNGALESALFIYEGSVDVALADDSTKAVKIIISDGSDISPYVDLHSGDAPIAYPGAGECVINTGLSERYGFQLGDTLTAYDEDMNRLTLTVSGIFDNFVYNYIYVRSDSVLSQWGFVPECNAAYANCADGADTGETAAAIAALSSVSNVTVNRDIRLRFVNMMSSLNYIVLLIIVCAGALAFIVLYNLTNINITERTREIATVKVLGFTLKETANYVLAENLVLSALGALVGLPLGTILHRFVMSQIRVDQVVFDIKVLPPSYGLAIVFTLGFALLVNLAMLRKIDAINMAESLKTIE